MINDVGKSLIEIENYIKKLDEAIILGEMYIHAMDVVAGDSTLDELPKNIQEEYMEMMSNLASSKELRADLVELYRVAKKIEAHIDRAKKLEEDKNNGLV